MEVYRRNDEMSQPNTHLLFFGIIYGENIMRERRRRDELRDEMR